MGNYSITKLLEEMLRIYLLSFIISVLYVKDCKSSYAGDQCYLQSGAAGVCQLITDCLPAIQDLKKGVRPVQCGFDGNLPVVCCLKKSEPIEIGLKSKEACQQYNKKPRRPVLGIINGLPASAGEFPHMVALGFGDPEEIEWLCAGTLVSEKFVITAAHCVQSPSSGPVRWARLGTINLREPEKGGYVQDYEISRRISHPDFQPPSTYNDIAVLELNDTISNNPFVQPACLQTEFETGPIGQAIGWGKVAFGGNSTDNLMKVDLNVYLHDICNKAYENVNKRILEKGIEDESQLCAGGGYNESKDTCQGDSGGPLHVPYGRAKLFKVIGVTSFGKGCGMVNVPGIYTRVSHFIPWIESIVWP